MKSLRILIIIATGANLLTLIALLYATNQPGGSGVSLGFAVLIFPGIWLISILTAIICCIVKRKYLFKKQILKWTIITLIFTTPIPFILIFRLTHPVPSVRRYESMLDYRNGMIYKTEYWDSTATGIRFANKIYVADSSDASNRGEAAYKKDSIWVYLNRYGDTIKLEYYKNDTLLSI